MTQPLMDGTISPPTTDTTDAIAGSYRGPTLATIYPSHNTKTPIAVAVQRDGMLVVAQITLQHAAGLAATLAHLVATEIERMDRNGIRD
jgi:hypothetical protein